MIKNKLQYIAVLLMALVATACVNDDTALQDLIAADPRIKPILIDIDMTPLDEGQETIPTNPADETYNDYWENNPWTVSVKVTYNDGEATVSTSNSRVKYTIEGAHVTIRSTASRMHIVASGETADGSLKVYSDYKYRLTLDGLSLANSHGAAINNQCGKTLYLCLAEESANALYDSMTYDYVEGEDMKGALFSEGQVIISGKGSLDVYANCRHGIATDDYLRVRKGVRLYVTTRVGNCLRGNDGVFIDGGVVGLRANGAGSKGISSHQSVTVGGGRTMILSHGEPRIETIADPLTGEAIVDTVSAAGVKCDSLMAMTAGTLRIKATGEGGKGLKLKSDFTLTGGDLEIVTIGRKGLASSKGIKVDGITRIEGGSLYSFSKFASAITCDSVYYAPGAITHDAPSKHFLQVKY